MSLVNKPLLKSKNEYYALGIITLGIILNLINSLWLPGNEGHFYRAVLLFPGAFIGMIFFGAIHNYFFSPQIEFVKAAKVMFYVYVAVVVISIIPYLFMA